MMSVYFTQNTKEFDYPARNIFVGDTDSSPCILAIAEPLEDVNIFSGI